MLKTKNKKAMEMMNWVVVTVIIIASAVILIYLFSGFWAKFGAKEPEITCRESIALRAASTVEIAGAEVKAAPIRCKTMDKKIKGSKEEVKSQFADSMASCWSMFGEGRYKKNVFDNLAIMGGKRRCFICYTLMIEESDDFKKGEQIPLEEFKDFLIDAPYPKLKDWTYLSYFQRYGGSGQVLGVFSEQGITPYNAYAIGFKAKASKCSWCKYIMIGSGASSAVGLILLAVPGGQLAGASLIIAGATGSITATKNMLEEEFFKEVDRDTIFVVDMKQEYLKQLFQKACEEVEEDIAGK